MIKELLLECLNDLKLLHNIYASDEDKINEIELFSGIKPSGYCVPRVMDYLNHPPYSDRENKVQLAWYVEIWINRICVWRNYHIQNNDENPEVYEDRLLNITIRDIIKQGIYGAYNDTKARLKKRGEI